MSRIVPNVGAIEELQYPSPEPGRPRKVQIHVHLPPGCMSLVKQKADETADNLGDGGNKALPEVTASSDGSELHIIALDNMTVHKLQMLILKSATEVPTPFQLRYLPAPKLPDVDVISPNNCTEQTFLRVDQQLARILRNVCPDVMVRLHEYHRVLLRKPMAFVSGQLNAWSKKIPEQLAMALQLLNEALNRNGCPNAVVEMEFFVHYPTASARKSAWSVAQKCMGTIRDLTTKAGADGLID